MADTTPVDGDGDGGGDDGPGASPDAAGGAGGDTGDAAAVPVIEYRREMAGSHRDFFRILPKAMGDVPHEVDGPTVRARLDGGTLTIDVGEERVRRIALLALPYAEVSFTFRGVPVERQQAFKRRFDLSYQRGGG